MATEKEAQLLSVTVDELRRHYDYVCTGFNHLRTKALALLGGEVAIVTFLFSADSNAAFIPKVVYGAVFLLIGIALMTTAFLLFLWVLSPATWHHPPETKLTRKLNKNFNSDPNEFMEYLKDEYNEIIERCIAKTGARATKFNIGLYSLAFGTVILIMLKYGGGLIKL